MPKPGFVTVPVMADLLVTYCAGVALAVVVVDDGGDLGFIGFAGT